MEHQNESRPLAIGLTAISALGRLAPHLPNVTPLGGSCLFAGSRVPGFLAYLLPVAVMAATDPFVGGYSWTSLFVYAAFLINVFIGRTLVRKVTAMRVGAAAFLCSLQFFLVSNFGVWAMGAVRNSPFHRPGFAGLIITYELGIPFWGRTLAGDLFFSALLFAVYELVVRRAGLEKRAVTA
jgi:hypothetical protein